MADLLDAKGEYFTKDPDAKLDFTLDWALFLGADTIATSAWTLPSGITQSSPAPSNTATTTTIWLTGGTLGLEYELVNRITTAGARTDDRTLRIRVIPYPALAANALITIPYLKAFLETVETVPDDSIDNDLLGKLIDSSSDFIENVCRRKFKSANYVERVPWGCSINLKNYPVQYVQSIHRATRDGLILTNGATKDYATSWVSADRKLYLNISGGASHGLTTLDLTLAGNDTLAELVTAVNAIGSGWAASLATGRSGNERSEDLIEASPQPVETSGLTLVILEKPDASSYFVNEQAGVITVQSGTPMNYGFVVNGNQSWVKYRAGYDTIPDDLQSLCARIAKSILDEIGRDSGLLTERIGDYSYTRPDSAQSGPIFTVPQNLQAELELWISPSG